MVQPTPYSSINMNLTIIRMHNQPSFTDGRAHVVFRLCVCICVMCLFWENSVTFCEVNHIQLYFVLISQCDALILTGLGRAGDL